MKQSRQTVQRDMKNALTARAAMVAHTASPTGSIVVHTPVECIQVFPNQSKEPIEMVITPGRETMRHYFRSLRLDQLPHFAT